LERLSTMLRYPTSILCLSIISLLVLSAQPAVFGSSPSSIDRTAAVPPSGVHHVSGLALVTRSRGVKPVKIVNVKATAGGYGQNDTKPEVAGGIDGWIVPTGTCNPSNAAGQETYLIAWYDAYTPEPVYAGILLYCPQGYSGAPYLYLADLAKGVFTYYTGINVGDEVTALVGAYNSTTFVFHMVDYTNSASVEDYWNTGSQVPLSDFNGIIDTASGCATSTGICPQVNFGIAHDGSAFFKAPKVSCATNPDKTTPAFPCAGYGSTLSSSTYYYPIGNIAKHPAVTILKYTMVEGDTSLSGTFTVTGALAFGDRASHTYTFKLP
jgi:hypothetical protein